MVVKLMSQYTGRGPTKARTYINDDVVTVILRENLTKAERTLVGHDRGDVVLSARTALQKAMHGDLVAGVQAIMGREVVAFLSANSVDPDYAAETFILGGELTAREIE
jgi:uncharacterized protein YbcI